MLKYVFHVGGVGPGISRVHYLRPPGRLWQGTLQEFLAQILVVNAVEDRLVICSLVPLVVIELKGNEIIIISAGV